MTESVPLARSCQALKQCAEVLRDAPRVRAHHGVRGLLGVALKRLDELGDDFDHVRPQVVVARSWCLIGIDTPSLSAAKMYAVEVATLIDRLASAAWNDRPS